MSELEILIAKAKADIAKNPHRQRKKCTDPVILEQRKERAKQRRKEWLARNPDYYRKVMKKRYDENPERKLIYYKIRYETDTEFRQRRLANNRKYYRNVVKPNKKPDAFIQKYGSISSDRIIYA